MKNFTFIDAPAARAVYTFYRKHTDTGKTDLKLKGIQLCIIKNKYLYDISYDFAPVGIFDEYYPTVEIMVNSLEFI